MKPKTRNILIIVGVVAVFVIGLVGYGAYSIYSFFSQFSIAQEIPDEIKEARVLKGRELFTRTEMFKLSQESFLKTIGDGAKIKDEKERQKFAHSQTAKGIYNFSDLSVFGNEIIAVGQFGGYVFDLNGNLKKQIAFEPVVEKIKIGPYEQDTYQANLDNLRIVQLEKDKFGFLSFGSIQGARVFDENGNQIWSIAKENVDLGELFKDGKDREADYEKKTYVLEAAVGDLDNDGISEYIVARKKDGIRAYNRNGNEMWFQPDDFPSAKLRVVDLNKDGRNELLEIGSKVRDGNGKLIREIDGDSDDMVLLVEDKNKKTTIQICDISDLKLTCDNEAGDKILEYDAPLSEVEATALASPPAPASTPIFDGDKVAIPVVSFGSDNSERIYEPRAVRVALKKDQPRYLAVIASFIFLPRANLYIYEPNGMLAYHELLDEDAETIAILPTPNGNEEILVGGKDTIWRYSLK